MGLKVTFEQLEAPFMTFLEDSRGRITLELYHKPEEEIYDFQDQRSTYFSYGPCFNKAEKDRIG